MPFRTRFAPSPTGQQHIGGIRTAIFAYLVAKQSGGQFILRLEDTDQAREVPGSLDIIIEALNWVGTTLDEGPHVGGEYGPYIQSQRLDIYKKYAHELVEQGKAYYDFRTVDELEALRNNLRNQNKPPLYKGHQNDWSTNDIQTNRAADTPYVIRLVTPVTGSIVVQDVIRGDIQFQAETIDDTVLLKSDGFPTYHLAHIVDDHLMQITHVIRGEEWLPSAPKHVLLYQAFGWDVPQLVHVPVFLSKSGGKMSKRDGDTSILTFREKGYLPEAVVNFSVLLGWNPKSTEEFFTLDQLVTRFSLEAVNPSGAIFEYDKLDWMNRHYLRTLSVDQMLNRMKTLGTQCQTPEYAQLYKKCVQWFSEKPIAIQASIWQSLQERVTTLLDVAAVVNWTEPINYGADDLIWKNGSKETTLQALLAVRQQLDAIAADHYSASQLEAALIPWIKESDWGNGDVLWPMRFALSGQKNSPSPFEMAELLGKTETLNRLTHAYDILA